MEANPIIVALDVPNLARGLEQAEKLRSSVGALKVGLELIMAEGPQAARAIHEATGLNIFLDTKLHDIPNTVAGAIRSAKNHGAWMLNVHATGGAEMMKAAKEAAGETLVIAVTILTSLDAEGMRQSFCSNETPRDAALRLSALAQECGLDGVVCSPQEARAVRDLCGPKFLIVTPGVRPAGAAVGDQKRVATPKEALQNGADYLVIGRPITGAEDPAAAARAILQEIAE